MIIGHNILESKAIPLIEGLPCDALYFVLDKAVVDTLPSVFGTYITKHKSKIVAIQSDEKSLSLVTELWDWLMAEGASRRSIIVAIGGGTLTDVVGFVAATYMRGLRTLNIPTTLLAMVDASVGGKTGIDYGGRKNFIGAFHEPIECIIDTDFLRTLPIDELFSGYAEVIKTALLSGESFWQRLLSLNDPQQFSDSEWLELVEACVDYKTHIVSQDPKETSGLRAVLNLGHTVAHALEIYSREQGKSLRHGEAVVIGLIVESYMAYQHFGLERQVLKQMMAYLRELYPKYHYTCQAYPRLIELMRSDKKNSQGEITFVLLRSLGQAELWRSNTPQMIEDALDFYREAFG